MSDRKETAQKLVVKNKLVFIFCISFILLSLSLVCYLFFFRSITIDVSKDMSITYEGENGAATVSITNEGYNFNQRTQEFLDSITYHVTPNKNLSNGTILTIQADWYRDLEDKYNINVINDVIEIQVEGLVERYAQSEDIPQTLLETVTDNVNQYFDRNKEMIIQEEFSQFNELPSEFQKQSLYRVFLQAMDIENKDKIIDIYKLSANDKNEAGEDVEKSVYYMVIVDEINTSNTCKEENIYGEHLDVEQLNSIDELVESLRNRFLLSYTMSVIA